MGYSAAFLVRHGETLHAGHSTAHEKAHHEHGLNKTNSSAPQLGVIGE
jgi:hypothetical protein